MRLTQAAPAALTTLSVLGLALLPSGADAKQGGILTENGRIGALQVGRSNAKQVKARIGRPTATGYLRTGASMGRSLRLRYDCGRGRSTSFYFDPRGRLANFGTNCRSWYTAAGTRVGDDYDTALELEPGRLVISCGSVGGSTIELTSSRASLFVSFETEGDPVTALAVAGRNSVLGC